MRCSASDARLKAVINALVEKQVAAIEGACGFDAAARAAALDAKLAGDWIEGVVRRVGFDRMRDAIVLHERKKDA